MNFRKDNLKTPLLAFIAASLFMGLYMGLYDPSFNNYLAQVHNVEEVTRGALEFPRELPGFLVIFLFAALSFLPDTRMVALATFLVGVSLIGQAYWAPGLTSVVVWMLVWSVGSHLYLAVSPAIGLRLAVAGQEGRLLGKISSFESLGSLMGMLLIYLGASYFNFSFAFIFTLAGICAFLAAYLLFVIKPVQVSTDKKQLIFKKKYMLFYILNILFGARKQIFLTFAPWVLIKIFNRGIETFAILGFIGTVLSLVFRPLLGRAIDHWGERLIITIESLLLVIICVLYGFAERWFIPEIAVMVIMGCFVLDQLLFAVRIARTTYLNKIVENKDDIGPTLSMGLSLDHIVSMTVPFFGGILWVAFGYEWVFLLATVIALANLGVAYYIPVYRKNTGSAA